MPYEPDLSVFQRIRKKQDFDRMEQEFQLRKRQIMGEDANDGRNARMQYAAPYEANPGASSPNHYADEIAAIKAAQLAQVRQNAQAMLNPQVAANPGNGGRPGGNRAPDGKPASVAKALLDLQANGKRGDNDYLGKVRDGLVGFSQDLSHDLGDEALSFLEALGATSLDALQFDRLMGKEVDKSFGEFRSDAKAKIAADRAEAAANNPGFYYGGRLAGKILQPNHPVITAASRINNVATAIDKIAEKKSGGKKATPVPANVKQKDNDYLGMARDGLVGFSQDLSHDLGDEALSFLEALGATSLDALQFDRLMGKEVDKSFSEFRSDSKAKFAADRAKAAANNPAAYYGGRLLGKALQPKHPLITAVSRINNVATAADKIAEKKSGGKKATPVPASKDISLIDYVKDAADAVKNADYGGIADAIILNGGEGFLYDKGNLLSSGLFTGIVKAMDGLQVDRLAGKELDKNAREINQEFSTKYAADLKKTREEHPYVAMAAHEIGKRLRPKIPFGDIIKNPVVAKALPAAMHLLEKTGLNNIIGDSANGSVDYKLTDKEIANLPPKIARVILSARELGLEF